VLSQLITDPYPTGSRLAVSVDWVEGTVVLRGELDQDSAHHLADALHALTGTDHATWVLDTAEVTWCDAGGLRALAAAHAFAVASGRQLRLVRSSRCVDRLVTLSGLDRLMADSLRPGRGRIRAVRGARPAGYPLRSVPS
jgi:anti-sigma B factor antagonist